MLTSADNIPYTNTDVTKDAWELALLYGSSARAGKPQELMHRTKETEEKWEKANQRWWQFPVIGDWHASCSLDVTLSATSASRRRQIFASAIGH